MYSRELPHTWYTTPKKKLPDYMSLTRTARKRMLKRRSNGFYQGTDLPVLWRDERYVSSHKWLVKDHEELINARHVDSGSALQNLSSSYMRNTMAARKSLVSKTALLWGRLVARLFALCFRCCTTPCKRTNRGSMSLHLTLTS